MENSLANKKPWLVAEWSERNGSISPDDVPYGSKKLYWWHGSCGHDAYGGSQRQLVRS